MGRYDPTKKKKTGQFWFWISVVIVAISIAAGWMIFDEMRSLKAIESQAKVLPEPEFDDSMMAAELLADTETNVWVDHAVESATVILPELTESDDFIRQGLIELGSGLASWLPSEQLLRRCLLIVNDFSQGVIIAKHMVFLKPKQGFIIEQDQSGQFIAETSYQRFDAFAAAIDAINIEAAIDFYQTVRPLMLEIYAEFGYPEGHRLEDLFLQAGAQILAAPIVNGRIAVVRPSVNYRYADPKLEALSSVQKQMIRLGPQNGRIIQNKVRKWVERLSAASE